MNRINQYGALFDAAGVQLNFDTRSATLEVASVLPDGVNRGIIDAAIADISMYEDTANYVDGMAAVFHADFIDWSITPFTDEQRENVLTELGIKSEGKFVSQYLATQKTNRSWHTSEQSGACTYFGAECTSRGTLDVPGKRGRKSFRKPTDFHRLSSTGIISREQLVTKGVEGLYRSIPTDNLVSGTDVSISFNKLKKLPEDKLQEILEAIEQIKKGRNV